jgi:hypothetical protein
VVPPAAPTVTAASPGSPSNDTTPEVRGSGAEAGSTVKVYDNASCSRTPLGSGSAAAFNGGAGITVAVPDDSTTDLHAAATDPLGNASACSGGFEYREATTPPVDPQPVILSLAVTPRKFAADPSATPLVRAAGTKIEITLSESARVRFHVRRDPPGHGAGGETGAPNLHAFRRSLPAGANTVDFSGTLGKRTFEPGRYVLTGRARDSADQASDRLTTGFKILP